MNFWLIAMWDYIFFSEWGWWWVFYVVFFSGEGVFVFFFVFFLHLMFGFPVPSCIVLYRKFVNLEPMGAWLLSACFWPITIVSWTPDILQLCRCFGHIVKMSLQVKVTTTSTSRPFIGHGLTRKVTLNLERKVKMLQACEE